MTLRTLGGLSVEGVTFRREKVLLLLAYLCLEGPQPRRRLAAVFWPEAANPMNSLAQHLVHLRGLEGALAEDGPRVAAGLPCDAALLRGAVRRGRHAEAAALYAGPFLHSLGIPLGADLEEWVFDTREALARDARTALLTLAAQDAARGQAERAGELAAQALSLPGAPPPDELDLPKLHHLLTLAGHPLAAQVDRDARSLGLKLGAAVTVSAAPFAGRAEELAVVHTLTPGTFAWISGHAGMGKTALLDALARSGGWRILAGQADPAYATLAPLSAAPPTSAHAALGALRDPGLRLAVDSWDTTDPATQLVLRQAAQARPGAVIVVTGRTHPPFDVDTHVHLGPLPPADLSAWPDLHARTDGHPTLVGAALRGQPLDLRFGARVRTYPDHVRDTFLLLALQDQPNLRATRAALNLDADTFARTVAFLTTEGLTVETGRVYAAATTREYLNRVHVHAALLHLKLARTLPEPDAWPHYEQARDLWEDTDETRAAGAACHRAHAHLKRGYPGQAATLLDLLAHRADLAVPHAWALIGAGRYNDALARLDALGTSGQTGPEVRVARATTLVRLGRTDEAVTLVADVRGSGPEAAHAASVQAQAAYFREHWAEARRHAQMAADLWQLHGDDEARVNELVMVARAAVRLGSSPQAAFQGVLAESEGRPSLHGTALVNYSLALMEGQQASEAECLMQDAIRILKDAGDRVGLAAAYGNLGVRRHMQGQLAEAARLYRQTMELLKGSGNVRQLGRTLSNLSEIEGDLSAFEDALHLLERAGQHELAERIRRNALLHAATLPSLSS
ncbi:tetratricopeptide repeat protein [Deinococcus taeanensis]|uniref:tetratricopeptide repeat protein n=1 Tax=Deinococcus taeanensis TaxID=2737050 RepID=UPI001CDCDAC2|nr:tetratricopeptide repeat protein [Deinococcus taeanensis]UBV43332.1 tetratricopeptide repeat protein [Deinococcus taeanensis]